jgi:hypothetical protein
MFQLSGAAPQRYPSATPTSHRACSSCQIPAQICGICHGAIRSPTSLLLFAFSLPYIAYVCFKCFRRFRCMLQLFHLDVAKVHRGILHMLQVFQKHVASVYSKCFICFQTYVAIVFLILLLRKFYTYVATVCSKCFSCFNLMLQQVVSCCKSQF